MNILLSNVKENLGEQFIGMYLYGSLASGDFDPRSTDIDFVVVTKEILPDETISKLETLHNQIWSSSLKWASKLEGAYVPKDLIRHHARMDIPAQQLTKGSFTLVIWEATGLFNAMSFANMVLYWMALIPNY